MNTRHRAFTRLDLVVVSLLVILSMGMAVPAAQEVKEQEKRKRCVNHLKQLGLAAHNHDSTYIRLPSGWLGPLVNESVPQYDAVQNVSVLVQLLPFLEEDNTYRLVQIASRKDKTASPRADYLTNTKQYGAWFLDEELIKAASVRINRFLCPSAPDTTKAADGVIVGVHFANKGGDMDAAILQPPMHALPATHAAFAKLGRTNYFGVAGLSGRGTNMRFPGTVRGFARFEGVFTNRSQCSVTQMTSADGASNTLLFGEATGGSHDWQTGKAVEKAPMQFAFSWMGAGALPTGGGLATHGGPSLWYQFSSTHEDVVNFCFGDGSVRPLRVARTSGRLFPKFAPPEPEPASASAASPYWILQELGGKSDAGIRPADSVIVKE